MKRSRFNKSFYRLTSLKMGELTPIGIQMVNMGDIVKMSTSAFLRTKPLATPPMHPVHAKIHHVFVPTRLIWDDFEDFITGGEDGLDASVAPYMTSTAAIGYNVGSLADTLGIPPGVASKQHSALPVRAVIKAWNDLFRDSQLQAPLALSTASGADVTTYSPANACPRVCWEKDFFTTARPDPQLGPDVVLPLENAEVVTDATNIILKRASAAQELALRSTNASTSITFDANATGDDYMQFGSNTGLEAEMSGIAPTIRSLRLAAAIQWYQENQNAYGGRYVEYQMRNGVRASDARLQRAEYLGGGKQTIQFSEVLQTAPAYVPSDDEQNGVVGDMAGHGVGAMRSNAFKYYCEEHGYIISFVTVKPITMYVDGLHRMFSLNTKEDYFQKELQHVGMEEVSRGQVYWADPNEGDAWAYQNRYDWMRRNESGVSGLFRTTYADWHFARMLSTLDNLEDFIECFPQMRPFADTSDIQNILGMFSHRVQVLSFLSKFGNTKGLTL